VRAIVPVVALVRMTVPAVTMTAVAMAAVTMAAMTTAMAVAQATERHGAKADDA